MNINIKNIKPQQQYWLFLILLISLVTEGTIYAQVGIGTSSPSTTLDVNGDAATSTSADGIIAPRVTLANLLAKDAATYNTAQEGAIVYVTDATGIPAGETANVSSTGYYFFDGAVWQRLDSSSTINIYDNNGTITDGITRTVEMGTSPESALNFDSDDNTLFIDSENNRVGIGTDSPTSTLHVEGGDFTLDIGRGNVVFENNTNSNSDGVGVTLRTPNNPTTGSIFDVRSAGQASRLFVGQSVTSPGLNSFYFGGSGMTVGFEYDTASYVSVLQTDGTVGIGTNMPTATLDVDGSTRLRGTLADENNETGTAGQVLSATATGTDWVDATTDTNTNIFSDDGTLSANRTVTMGSNNLSFNSTSGNMNFDSADNTLFIDGTNDRIGIGMSNPSATLEVDGDLKVNTVNETPSNSSSVLVIEADGSVTKRTRGTHKAYSNVPSTVVTSMLDITGGGVFRRAMKLYIAGWDASSSREAFIDEYLLASNSNTGRQTLLLQAGINGRDGTQETPQLSHNATTSSITPTHGRYTIEFDGTGAGKIDIIDIQPDVRITATIYTLGGFEP